MPTNTPTVLKKAAVKKISNLPNAEKTAFAFSETTLSFIKDGAKNYEKFKKAIAVIRKDAFIYGLKAGFGGNAFTQRERLMANYCFDKVEAAVEICKTWDKSKTWVLFNTVDTFNGTKVKGDRFSSADLFDELVKITYFWKEEVDGGMPNINEAVPALMLWEWFIPLYCQIGIDQDEYSRSNN